MGVGGEGTKEMTEVAGDGGGTTGPPGVPGTDGLFLNHTKKDGGVGGDTEEDLEIHITIEGKEKDVGIEDTTVPGASNVGCTGEEVPRDAK